MSELPIIKILKNNPNFSSIIGGLAIENIHPQIIDSYEKLDFFPALSYQIDVFPYAIANDLPKKYKSRYEIFISKQLWDNAIRSEVEGLIEIFYKKWMQEGIESAINDTKTCEYTFEIPILTGIYKSFNNRNSIDSINYRDLIDEYFTAFFSEVFTGGSALENSLIIGLNVEISAVHRIIKLINKDSIEGLYFSYAENMKNIITIGSLNWNGYVGYNLSPRLSVEEFLSDYFLNTSLNLIHEKYYPEEKYQHGLPVVYFESLHHETPPPRTHYNSGDYLDSYSWH